MARGPRLNGSLTVKTTCKHRTTKKILDMLKSAGFTCDAPVSAFRFTLHTRLRADGLTRPL